VTDTYRNRNTYSLLTGSPVSLGSNVRFEDKVVFGSLQSVASLSCHSDSELFLFLYSGILILQTYVQ
jgi:hypothetical protein